MPVEQRAPEACFQVLDILGEHRLTDVHLLRSSREMQLLSKRND
jgi:hypothetical protein